MGGKKCLNWLQANVNNLFVFHALSTLLVLCLQVNNEPETVEATGPQSLKTFFPCFFLF